MRDVLARPGLYFSEKLDAGHDDMESYLATVNMYSEPLFRGMGFLEANVPIVFASPAGDYVVSAPSGLSEDEEIEVRFQTSTEVPWSSLRFISSSPTAALKPLSAPGQARP